MHVEVHAGENVARAAPQTQITHFQNGSRHNVAVFHLASSLRAACAIGSDIARYSAAHSAPGMTQLPRFVAKICVCFVSSGTVSASTDTSDESFSIATKSLVIGASASRNAWGPRISRRVCRSV